MSTMPSPFRGQAVSSPLRETLEDLCQVQDYDGFVQMTLVQLDMMFEQDPATLDRLQTMEHALEDVERMDWPAPSALSLRKAKA